MSAGKKSRTGNRVELKQKVSHELALLERPKRTEVKSDAVVRELVVPPPVIAPPIIVPEKPQPPKPVQIGEIVPEGQKHAGRIYGGLSKTDGKPLYIAAENSGVMRWKEATRFAAGEDARVPSSEELSQIHALKDTGALKDTFNRAGEKFANCYWSSITDSYYYSAHALDFSNGKPVVNLKATAYAVRLVWS